VTRIIRPAYTGLRAIVEAARFATRQQEIVMTDQPDPPAPRPRLLDDLAGVAGGAVSALVGLKQEASAIGRARIDEAIRRLDLVRREEMDAALEMAAAARTGQAAAEAAIAALQARIEALEARLAALEAENSSPGGGGPGIIT
jgi:BMFP domain-containing protein YqiC